MDLYLDSILFSYRVSVHDSTKYSPFFLVYGRNAKLPVEFNIKSPEDGEMENHDVSTDGERNSSDQKGDQDKKEIKIESTPKLL